MAALSVQRICGAYSIASGSLLERALRKGRDAATPPPKINVFGWNSSKANFVFETR